MTIRIPFDTDNGLTNFHVVDQAELKGMEFKLRVNSYPTKQDADNKTGILWQTYPMAPLTAFSPAGLASFEEWLVAQPEGSNPFAGGEFIPYPPPPEPIEPADPQPPVEGE